MSNETKERLAKVYLVGKEITKERTVRVHCHLTEEDPSLIPGMYFSAVIETNEQTSDVLPNEAIVNFEGKDFIFLANPSDDHRYNMIAIVKGLSEGNYTTVAIPEVALNKSVVIKGTYALLGLLKNKEE